MQGAADIFKQTFNIIYKGILPATSAFAAAMVAYNIVILMASKNQRKADDAYTQIKIIARVWLYIMLVSVFITIAVQGFNEAINSSAAEPLFRH